MFDCITFNPQIMGGRACIRGMRVKNGILRLKKVVVVLACVLSIALPGTVYAQSNDDAKVVFEKMGEAYLKLSTYQDIGILETQFKGEKQAMSTGTFSVSFKRPNFLRFEHVRMHPRELRMLWSNEKDAFSYLESLNQYKKVGDLREEMGRVQFDSAGTVPLILIGGLTDPHFVSMSNLRLLPQEDVEGTQCYVLAGKDAEDPAMEYKLWVGAEDYLLRKGEHTYAPSKEALQEGAKQALSMVKKSGDPLAILGFELMRQSPPSYSQSWRAIHRDIKINTEISEGVFTFIPPSSTKPVEQLE
jgi:outer membrane lipoprotein-sorting protein